MRRSGQGRALVALVATTAYTSLGAADEGVGAELGLRAGYAIPFGKVKGDVEETLSDHVVGAVPFRFDLGYRFSPRVMVGAYFQYGVALLRSELSEQCDESEDGCPSTVTKLGAQLHYHVLPGKKVDPWVGVGVGYEWLSLGGQAGLVGGPYGARGVELLELQGGVDLAATGTLASTPKRGPRVPDDD